MNPVIEWQPDCEDFCWGSVDTHWVLWMCNTLAFFEDCSLIQIKPPYSISDLHVNKAKVFLSTFLSALTKKRNALKGYDLNHLENTYIAVLFPCVQLAVFALILSAFFWKGHLFRACALEFILTLALHFSNKCLCFLPYHSLQRSGMSWFNTVISFPLFPLRSIMYKDLLQVCHTKYCQSLQSSIFLSPDPRLRRYQGKGLCTVIALLPHQRALLMSSIFLLL